MSAEYYCTICCKKKSNTPGEIPAITRYLSERITKVKKMADEEGKGMLILSGLYGLILSDTPIPFYDHRLVVDEVPAMIEKVVDQCRKLNAKKIVFFGREKEEEGWEPYYQVIEKAAQIAQVELEEKILKD